jgi:hypothetical protein
MDPREHDTTGRGDVPAGGNHDETAPRTTPADEEAPRRRGNRHQTGRRRNRSQPAGAARDGGADRSDGERTAAPAHPGRTQASMQSGRTPGRRAAGDPGAVPLGTDEEAAGTPPDAAAVEEEIVRAEQQSGRRGLTAEQAMKGRPSHPEESPRGFGRLVTVSAAVVIAIIVLFLLF